MRIDFLRSGRPGLDWSGDALHIGSAPHHPVCLQGAGIAADHAILTCAEDGIWLQVAADADRVYVNARPVRGCALLRLGDTLSIGGHRMLLRAADCAPADDDATLGNDHASTDAPLPAVSLRTVAGPCSGRIWSVHARLQLARSGHRVVDANSSDDAALTVCWRQHELWLDVQPGLSDAVSVNGVAIAGSTRLYNADCIGLGPQRFVVDAWALTPDTDNTDDASDMDIDAEPPVDAAGPRGEVWWLILTAAVLGLLIALFLFLRL